MRYSWSVILAISGALAASAAAATVTFDLAPVTAMTGNEVVVTPGQQVEYQLIVTVVSDTAEADNHGLELFQLSIQTGSGVTQAPLDAFAPTIAQNFTAFPSLGNAQNDTILDLGAAQMGLGTGFFEGVGVGQATVLATGHFNTPSVETTFTPKVAAGSTASVLGAGSKEGLVVTATGAAGPGFTIRTSNTAGGGGTSGDGTSGGGTSGDGTTGGGTSDGGTSGTDTTTQTPTPSPTTSLPAIGVAIGALLALAASFWLFGPMGLAVGLVIVPLLGLLIFLMGR